MKPIVAIVGRPNVGKSMLFNKLIGRRLSIVEDTPGVTRDRIYGEADWNGRSFTLIDTGGIEPRTDNQILAFMRDQAQIAIDNATVIIFLDVYKRQGWYPARCPWKPKPGRCPAGDRGRSSAPSPGQQRTEPR